MTELLQAILGATVIFAVVIVWAVTASNRRERSLQQITAEKLLESLVDEQFTPSEVLVGSLHTNWIKPTLEIRNFDNHNIATVTYGWPRSILVEVNGRTYSVTEITPPFLDSVLQTEGRMICHSRRKRWSFAPSEYDVPGVGKVVVEANWKSVITSSFRIFMNEQPLGRVFNTGKVLRGNIVLILRGDFAPEIRAYILAMEFRRMNSQ
ncbi:MAG: hypothetical protein ACOYNN_17980 [Terrimicrobiaceae bacterium]